MRAIRKVAATKRAVICTIHQPSTYLFEMFDSLLLLKKGGQVVFFGPVGEGSCNLIRYFEVGVFLSVFLAFFSSLLLSSATQRSFTLNDLFGKPWSQVSPLPPPLPPPRQVPSLLSRVGFSIPAARRFLRELWPSGSVRYACIRIRTRRRLGRSGNSNGRLALWDQSIGNTFCFIPFRINFIISLVGSINCFRGQNESLVPSLYTAQAWSACYRRRLQSFGD